MKQQGTPQRARDALVAKVRHWIAEINEKCPDHGTKFRTRRIPLVGVVLATVVVIVLLGTLGYVGWSLRGGIKYLFSDDGHVLTNVLDDHLLWEHLASSVQSLGYALAITWLGSVVIVGFVVYWNDVFGLTFRLLMLLLQVTPSIVRYTVLFSPAFFFASTKAVVIAGSISAFIPLAEQLYRQLDDPENQSYVDTMRIDGARASPTIRLLVSIWLRTLIGAYRLSFVWGMGAIFTAEYLFARVGLGGVLYRTFHYNHTSKLFWVTVLLVVTFSLTSYGVIWLLSWLCISRRKG